jgi:hypothetical protein
MQTDPTRPDPPASKRIQHTQPGFGAAGGAKPSRPASQSDPETAPLPVAKGVGQAKITAFGKAKRHEEKWKRTPNTTGQGAIHVRTFHSKLTADALAYMDQSVNEWLDAHPQYEVKFVNSTVGTLTGKLKEPNLICQVWV